MTQINESFRPGRVVTNIGKIEEASRFRMLLVKVLPPASTLLFKVSVEFLLGDEAVGNRRVEIRLQRTCHASFFVEIRDRRFARSLPGGGAETPHVALPILRSYRLVRNEYVRFCIPPLFRIFG